MKLTRFDYSEFAKEDREWRMIDCTFDDVNLLVGKNATGKTRTLNVIRGLADLLSRVPELEWGEGHHAVDFEYDGKIISYVLEYHNFVVERERLIVDSQKRLTRGSDGEGKILAAELDREIRFQIPVNQVAAFAKRDSLQHPFLENLYQWGKGLLRYDFGTPLGKDHYYVLSSTQEEEDKRTDLDLRQTQRVVEIFLRGREECSDTFIQSITEDMRSIGYEIGDIGVESVPGILLKPNLPVTPLGIYVKETDRQGKTFQPSMSQGMFRALSILIQINYSLLTDEPSCILVDDIGEGLDFGRSSSLVRIMIEKVQGSSSQLIMATNDRFIMNNVPLEYWIILERQGGKCIHRNYRNSRQMFDEFELTGLSNFDLFSSDYYLQGRNE
jgi:energy-coupling factor transporter ATP-binding protein EcfA2